MIINSKVKRNQFKHTNTQRFGGWGAYHKLYKQFKQTAKENAAFLNLNKFKRTYTIFKCFLQSIFKPFKQFYHYVSVSEGTAEIRTYEWDGIEPIIKGFDCAIRKRHYLFGILFYVSKRPMTEAEVKKEVEEK